MHAELVDAIDALLPQTQCTQCGYPGCRPYAEAVSRGDAEINRCAPGGAAGIRKLAQLLGRPVKPLDPAYGVEKPRAAALIDESRCIGCLLCLKACPVDAIVGATKRMHTVLTESCTGCELCLPPCPVDCIDMLELDALTQRGNRHAAVLATRSIEDMAMIAHERFEFHLSRLERDEKERNRRLLNKARGKPAYPDQGPASHSPDRKKATVQAAIERARKHRAAHDKQ